MTCRDGRATLELGGHYGSVGEPPSLRKLLNCRLENSFLHILLLGMLGVTLLATVNSTIKRKTLESSRCHLYILEDDT